nr:reverse transcriptase domain-containing protein [Tanacetum cinerariifolium]
MSDASSAVTYTSIYTDSEPWRYYEDESTETGSLGFFVYGYDRLPMQPAALPSPDYVPGPEHPPSPNYMPVPEHPPSPVEIPYVPEPEYPEYLAPSDDEAPLEDQPLPVDASPTAASPSYVANFNLNKDPEEDPDDHVDYPADGGDGDDDTDDEDGEPFEDEENEEHLAPADSSAVPIVDHHHYLYHLHHYPSPLTTIPTDTGAPLGYRAAGIRMRALLPSTSRRTDIPEADVPPQKRDCLTTLAPRFEVRESSTAGAARQPGPTKYDLRRYRVEQAGYRITDTWDEIFYVLIEIASTTLEGIYQRVTELDTTVRQRTDEFEIRFEEVQDDRALLRARVNTLFRDRPYHRCTSMLLYREAMTLKAQVATLIAQTSSLQTQLTIALGRIKILEARDPEPQEGPTEAGSSFYAIMYDNRCCYKMAPNKRTTRATPATITTPTTTVTNAQLQALIDRGVATTLAERDADRSRNGDNNNDSGTCERRQVTTQRECTYTDFLKCQPMRSALTWWTSHMRAVGQDVAYAMPWMALKRMITDKYCPRGEIQKLESEYWNLKLKGLDLLNYNQHFQELVLMCDRMFPKESTKVERYIGGLPDMIHGSVKASKPQLIQEV